MTGAGDLEFMDFEMRSYRCGVCFALISEGDEYCHKHFNEMKAFAEGSTEYLNWLDGKCVNPMPENPHPVGTKEHENWQTGFDDAMNYILNGQFEE